MTRWYYDDPLAAAWMAEKHGMRFTDIMRRPLVLAVSDGEFGWFLPDSVPYTDDEFLIHPDTLPLLKPQVGDLVAFSDEKTVYVCDRKTGAFLYNRREIDPYHRLMVLNAHFAGEPYLSMEKRIVERNGVAFHWPKCEDA